MCRAIAGAVTASQAYSTLSALNSYDETPHRGNHQGSAIDGERYEQPTFPFVIEAAR